MTDRAPEHRSRVGLWTQKYIDDPHRRVYGDPLTATTAARFLDHREIVTVEDWGSGYGQFRKHLGAHQVYVGIDGSAVQFADKVADLEGYTSRVDAVHMRHVLEHNPNWERILRNAISSFRFRMVLTVFTPYQDATRTIAEYPDFYGTGTCMVDLGFARRDLVRHFDHLRWTSEENVETDTQYGVEHMFFLERADGGRVHRCPWSTDQEPGDGTRRRQP